MLTAIEYQKVSQFAYLQHDNPATLVIPHGTFQHKSICLCGENKEHKNLCKEMISAEKALIKQLSQEIPSMYLKMLRNRHSNTIDSSIPKILSTLINTYGNVSEDYIKDEENSLRSKIFNIIEPLIVMYNEINDLQELATASRLQYSDPQIVNIGIRLIKNVNDFEKGLTG